MKLSILIPYKLEHQNYLTALLKKLRKQIKDRDVEVLTQGGSSYSNGGLPVGKKRNQLIDKSKGQYVVFIDADDQISDDYLDKIYPLLDGRVDVVCFNVLYRRGSFEKLVHYDSNYVRDGEKSSHYERLPNHLMPVKRRLAKRVKYPEIPYGEDAFYSRNLRHLIRRQKRIDKVLYIYDDCGSSLRETTRRRNRHDKNRQRK